ncbi:MAG: SulP family inorganic anion transporter [Methanoculleus sp.]|jgi:MFS superfamily sulfate permease-like transporter
MANLLADLMAGLTTSLVGIPQTMGFAIVAGIKPIYGLYIAVFSTAIGALLKLPAIPAPVKTASIQRVTPSSIAIVFQAQ